MHSHRVSYFPARLSFLERVSYPRLVTLNFWPSCRHHLTGAGMFPDARDGPQGLMCASKHSTNWVSPDLKKNNECFTGSSYQNQATVSLYLWRVGPVVPLSVASHSVVSVTHGQRERARTYLHVHSMLSWEGEGSHVHNFTVCLFRFGSLQCWRGCPGPCVWAARAYHWATPPSTQLLLYYIVTVLVTVNLLMCLIYESNLYRRHVCTGGNSTQRIRHLSCLTHPGQS